MSEQVQAILDAVQNLTSDQRIELMAALEAVIAGDPAHLDRKSLVQAIQGKYRHVPTSVDAFLRRKREEADLE